MTNLKGIKDWLLEDYRDITLFNEPMSRHTTFKTGGPADIFISPRSNEDAGDIIDRTIKNNIPLFVIGGGSNLLIKDEGIRGVVLSLKGISSRISMIDSSFDSVIVKAAAGLRTHELCSFAIKNGLAGMNFALGIPGTLGGSIRMNAGTVKGEIKDVLKSITILNGSGKLKSIEREDLSFSYRSLDWKGIRPEPVIMAGEFRLFRGDRQLIEKEADDLLRLRIKNQPVSLPSAGCIFKNPDPEHPAGRLIDLAGLKGKEIGNAMISDRHANFIVNKGNALSSDILALIDLSKKRVKEKFDIELETEVKIVG